MSDNPNKRTVRFCENTGSALAVLDFKFSLKQIVTGSNLLEFGSTLEETSVTITWCFLFHISTLDHQRSVLIL
jgi:hypothetical protein